MPTNRLGVLVLAMSAASAAVLPSALAAQERAMQGKNGVRTSMQSAAVPIVSSVRVGKHQDSTRVVLDISAPARFSSQMSADGQAVLVHLPEIQWTAGPSSAQHFKGPVTEYMFSGEPGGGGNLAILTSTPVRIKRTFTLASPGGRGYRIVFDLVESRAPASKARPRMLNASKAPAAPAMSDTGPEPAALPPRARAVIPNNDVAARTGRAETAPSAPPPMAETAEIPQRQVMRPQSPPMAPATMESNSAEQMRAPDRRGVYASADEPPRSTRAPGPSMGADETQKYEEVAQAQSDQTMSERVFGIDGVYIRGNAGLSFLNEISTAGAGNTATTDFDIGYVGGAALGLDFGNGFRVEGEANYHSNDIDTIVGTANGVAFNTANVGGSVSALSLLGNVAYDFDIGGPFSPFLMGGLGLVRLSINNASAAGVGLVDDSDWVFGYQLGGGVSYEVSRRLALEASYRYLDTADSEFSDLTGRPFDAEYSSHNVLVGARITF